MLQKLWVESYRPQTLDEIIFSSDKERKNFEVIVASGSLPNLLLVGHQGTGKTTLSLALVKEMGVDPADVLKINCSDEKIDAVRDKVKTFAYTMPMGKFKVVRLEEMDYLSQDAQALLRSLMEEVGDSCRFIATGNYINKILPAMRSRFQEHTFSAPSRDDALLRMADILVKQQIEFEVDDLEKVVEAGYPDLRKILQLIEGGSRTGKLVIRGDEAIQDWKLQLLPLLEKDDLEGARALVCKNAAREELVDVYGFLYRNLHRMPILNRKADEAVIKIAQYQYQHQFVNDPELQVAALFIELGALR